MTMKKLYSAPIMYSVPLKRQVSLMQVSDGERTPVLPPGPIGVAPFDEPQRKTL